MGRTIRYLSATDRLRALQAALLLAAFVYARAGLLRTFYANHPARFAAANNIGDFRVVHGGAVRNCEDMALSPQHGYALLSCDPGRDAWNTVLGTLTAAAAPAATGLYLYRYARDPDAPPQKIDLYPRVANASEFHPLGIHLHEPSRSLFVVNHAASGSRVDLFKFNAAGAYATFVGSIRDEEHLATPNAIAALSEREFFVTNDHYWPARKHPRLSRFETYAGLPGGTVTYMRIAGDPDHGAGTAHGATLAAVPLANGIALLNHTTLAVSSSTTAAVRLYRIWRNAGAHAAPRLELQAVLPLPFIPDNLSVDSAGKLLIAGHPHAPSLEKAARRNHACAAREPAPAAPFCDFPKLSWIVEWSEQGGVTTLYKGTEFGTSTTAVRDWERGVGFAVGSYERGLLAWRL